MGGVADGLVDARVVAGTAGTVLTTVASVVGVTAGTTVEEAGVFPFPPAG